MKMIEDDSIIIYLIWNFGSFDSKDKRFLEKTVTVLIVTFKGLYYSYYYIF